MRAWRLLFLLLGIGLGARSVQGADATFVGVLALANEEEVAQQLDLSPEVRGQLAKLIDRREHDALELSMTLGELPPDQQEAKLAPFRAESEAEGKKLFTPEQLSKLEQLRLERLGLAALRDPAVEKTLALPDEVQPAIKDLASREAAELVKVGDDERLRAPIRARYGRELMRLLTPAQKEQWNLLLRGAADNDGSSSTVSNKDASSELPPRPTIGKGMIRFNFKFTPWKDVLEWFAEQAEYSLVMEGPPAGTFNYQDERVYTPAEGIDLLNSILLTKGYTLVRHDRMLILANLQDGVPANLVPFVPLAELDTRADHELVATTFVLNRLAPEEADAIVKPLLGPQGTSVMLAKASQLKVTETAGNLRMIRTILDNVEQPDRVGNEMLRKFPLNASTSQETFATIKQLMGIPADKNANADNTLRLALEGNHHLLAQGRAEQLARLEQVVHALDGGSSLATMPQFATYPIVGADPASVLAVLQTLLSGQPDVRLALDPKTNHLIAQARPAQQATIRGILAEMQRDQLQIEFIRLHYLEPSAAMSLINRVLGGDEASAPRVESDPNSRQLIIHGTAAQIAQVKTLLEKAGESEKGSAARAGDTSTIRLIPLNGRSAQQALDQVQQLWPKTHKNRIRIQTPSSGLMRRHSDGSPVESDAPKSAPSDEKTPEKPQPEKKESHPASHGEIRQAQLADSPFRLAAFPLPGVTSPRSSTEPPEVLVMPGPTGLVVACDDPAVLSQFEELLRTLAVPGKAEQDYTIYYLKFVKAPVAADLLDQVFGNGGGGGGGSSIIGDIAGAAIGESGGNLVGSLFGSGGGSRPIGSAPVEIVPDARLNILIVRAAPAELDLIEQLLGVLDQESSPEDVQLGTRPRLIPVVNTSADNVATVIRQVYSERMGGASAAQRQPSPEELIQAIRGGKQSRNSDPEAQKLIVGVDSRTNSLIVSAPDGLFHEIEQLVEQLDQDQVSSGDTTRVVQIHSSSGQAVQKALASILKDNLKSSSSSSSSSTPATSSDNRGSGGGFDREQFRRQVEQFRNLQQQLNQGSRGGGGGGQRGGGGGQRGGGGGRRGG